jgi:ubiquinone/menaquinone biosynthesis C-methylase UbiE
MGHMSLGDFSAQADAYARARPTYPVELLDRLVAHAGVKPGDAVADLGAGTGIFTELLVARGFHVTAVEPNEPMRRQAKPLANATWINGTFESTGLPAASQQWAAAAQAFHWADPPRALPEVRRILKPGGCFTVLWNNREHDRHPVLVWTREAIRRCRPGFDDSYREKPWGDVLLSTGDFTDVVYFESRHVVPMSPERYLDLWRSHNRLRTLSSPEKFAAFMRELTEYLAARGDEPVDVSYVCKAWTARRAEG